MLNEMIAVCGLDCSICPAHLAWKNDDEALREKLQALQPCTRPCAVGLKVLASTGIVRRCRPSPPHRGHGWAVKDTPPSLAPRWR